MKRAVFIVATSLLVFGMLALALEVSPGKTVANTIIVPDDYPTIQEAVNASVDGTTILVRNGTYSENVMIEQKNNLSIIGMDGASVTKIRGVYPSPDG